MPSLCRSPDHRYLRTVIVTDVVLDGIRDSGIGGNRTRNLLDAIEALSCLSYDPMKGGPLDPRVAAGQGPRPVERRGIAPRFMQCERIVLLLNYRP